MCSICAFLSVSFYRMKGSWGLGSRCAEQTRSQNVLRLVFLQFGLTFVPSAKLDSDGLFPTKLIDVASNCQCQSLSATLLSLASTVLHNLERLTIMYTTTGPNVVPLHFEKN